MDDTDNVMTSRVVLKGKEVENKDLEKEKWKKQLSDHKMLVFIVITSYLSKTDIITSLAENIHNLLEISLSPSVPLSLRIISTKYNIIVCLWTYGISPPCHFCFSTGFGASPGLYILCLHFLHGSS